MEEDMTEMERGDTVTQGSSVMLDWDIAEDQGGKTLVGKMQISKRMNKNIVVSMIRKAWNLQEGLQILEMEENGFMFKFESKEECRRILKGRPWSIQGGLLNIQRCAPLMVYQEVKFEYCPFWVQFHNIPFKGMIASNARKLGEMIGEVACIENPQGNGKMLRSFIRARVLNNVHNPLLTGIWVPRPGRERIWVSIKYEKLQNYCYKCGVIAHEHRDCLKEKKMDQENLDQPMYGPWIAAPPCRTWEEEIIFCKQNWESDEGYGRGSRQGELRVQREARNTGEAVVPEEARQQLEKMEQQRARGEREKKDSEESRKLKGKESHLGGQSQRVAEVAEPQKQIDRNETLMGLWEQNTIQEEGPTRDNTPQRPSLYSEWIQEDNREWIESGKMNPINMTAQGRKVLINHEALRIEEVGLSLPNSELVEYTVETPPEEEMEGKAMVVYE